MTPKQSMFIKEYLIDLNATQAAIRAGYSAKTAEQIGHENLRKPEIAVEIEKAMTERSEKVAVSANDVLQSILDIRGMAITGKELSNALKANELLGRHLKMFTDKTEVTGKDGGPVETEVIIRPQVSREEWLAIHGLGTSSGTTTSGD